MEKGKAASNDPTYVLKVNLQCCNSCPKKIKRNLMKLSGVYSVAMDMEEGLVKISGRDNLDPSTLLNSIAKTGKLAEFRSFHNTAPAAPTTAIHSDQPDNLSGKSDGLCDKIDGAQNGNSGSAHFSDHHGRSGEVHTNEEAAANPPVAPPPRNRPFMRPPSQFGAGDFNGSRGFWRPMSEPMPPRPPRPMPPPPMPPAYGYYRWPDLPPPPPCCCQCQQQPPPVGNAPAHYLFNDENIEGCAIG